MTQPTKYITAYTGETIKKAPANPPVTKIEINISTPRQFRKSLEALERNSPKDGPYICFAIFDPPTRRDGNVTAKTAVVLDVENEGRPDLDALDIQGYTFGTYTTVNHTEDSPRWRVIVPLAKPFPVTSPEEIERFELLYYGIAATIKGGLYDTGGKDRSRGMYTPTRKANGERPLYQFAYESEDPDAMPPRPLDNSDVERLINIGRIVKPWATASRRVDFTDPATGEVFTDTPKREPLIYLMNHGWTYPESVVDVAREWASKQPQTPTLTEAGAADGDALPPEPRVNVGKIAESDPEDVEIDTERAVPEQWRKTYGTDPSKAKAYTPGNFARILHMYYPDAKSGGKLFTCIFPDHPDKDPSMAIAPSGVRVYCHGCKRKADMYDLVAMNNPELHSQYAIRKKTYKILDSIPGADGAGTLAEDFAEYIEKYAPKSIPPDPRDIREPRDKDTAAVMQDLKKTDTGRIRRIFENIRDIMRNDPKLTGIRWNLMTQDIDVTKAMPWKNGEAKAANQLFYDNLYNYVTDAYGEEFKPEDIRRAVAVVASENAYHPIREYLERLVWDGVPRVDRLLSDALGVDMAEADETDAALNRAVIRKTLSAAVQRVYNPGIRFQYCTVFVGPQGIGKSTFWATLGGPWFSDNLFFDEMKDKRGPEKIGHNWILELSEMQGKRKAEENTIKNFIKRDTDEYRPAYARCTEHRPRQCIFVATTNSEDGFLTDETGNRIWWIIETPGRATATPGDLDTDQVWAEVMAKYRKEPLHLEDPVLFDRMYQRQEKSIEKDPWTEAVEAYLNGCLTAGQTRVTTAAILDALNIPKQYGNSDTVKRIKLLMKQFPEWRFDAKGRKQIQKTDENGEIVTDTNGKPVIITTSAATGFVYTAESRPSATGEAATEDTNETTEA